MKHEIALQPDATIIIRDNVYCVSSSKLQKVSPILCNLVNTCKDRHQSLKLNPTEDAQAFLYFMRSSHGMFVPYEDVTSAILTEMALFLVRYDVKPNNPPYDLVQFCFTRRTLRPSRLSSLDLSRMLAVARVLGISSMKQLLLHIFEHDSVHQKTEPYGSDAQCVSLLGNIILKRNELCTIVGNLLVQSAKDLSVVVGHHVDLGVMKTLWDKAIWILTARPSPSKLLRSLSELQIPPELTIYVRCDEALFVVKDTCKEVERWLDSALRDVRYETQESGDFGFEQLGPLCTTENAGALASPIEIEPEEYDDCVVLSKKQVDDKAFGRSRTM